MILKENYYVDKSKVTTPLNGFSKNIGDVSLKEILFEIYCLKSVILFDQISIHFTVQSMIFDTVMM